MKVRELIRHFENLINEKHTEITNLLTRKEAVIKKLEEESKKVLIIKEELQLSENHPIPGQKLSSYIDGILNEIINVDFYLTTLNDEYNNIVTQHEALLDKLEDIQKKERRLLRTYSEEAVAEKTQLSEEKELIEKSINIYRDKLNTCRNNKAELNKKIAKKQALMAANKQSIELEEELAQLSSKLDQTKKEEELTEKALSVFLEKNEILFNANPQQALELIDLITHSIEVVNNLAIESTNLSFNLSALEKNQFDKNSTFFNKLKKLFEKKDLKIEALILSNTSLSAEAFCELASIISKNCTVIHRLYLSNTSIFTDNFNNNENVINALVTLLKQPAHQMQSIFLDECKINDPIIISFSKQVKEIKLQNNHLNQLVLWDNQISNPGALEYISALSECFPKIVERDDKIYLSTNKIKVDDEFVANLESLNLPIEKLSQLIIKLQGIKYSPAGLTRCLGYWKDKQIGSLDFTPIFSEFSVDQILTCKDMIKEIILAKGGKFSLSVSTTELLPFILPNLAGNSYTSIDFSSVKFSKEQLKTFLASVTSTSLRCLLLDQINNNVLNAKDIAEVICWWLSTYKDQLTSLDSLSLQFNQFSVVELKKIADALNSAPLKNLQYLYLSADTKNKALVEMYGLFGKSLQHCSALSVFSIKTEDNSSEEFDEKDAEILYQYFNPSISYNGSTILNAIIYPQLHQDKALIHFHVVPPQLSDSFKEKIRELFTSFKNAQKGNKKVSFANMGFNSLQLSSYVIDSLNENLEELDLSGNEFTLTDINLVLRKLISVKKDKAVSINISKNSQLEKATEEEKKLFSSLLRKINILTLKADSRIIQTLYEEVLLHTDIFKLIDRNDAVLLNETLAEFLRDKNNYSTSQLLLIQYSLSQALKYALSLNQATACIEVIIYHLLPIKVTQEFLDRQPLCQLIAKLSLTLAPNENLFLKIHQDKNMNAQLEGLLDHLLLFSPVILDNEHMAIIRFFSNKGNIGLKDKDGEDINANWVENSLKAQIRSYLIQYFQHNEKLTQEQKIKFASEISQLVNLFIHKFLLSMLEGKDSKLYLSYAKNLYQQIEQGETIRLPVIWEDKEESHVVIINFMQTLQYFLISRVDNVGQESNNYHYTENNLVFPFVVTRSNKEKSIEYIAEVVNCVANCLDLEKAVKIIYIQSPTNQKDFYKDENIKNKWFGLPYQGIGNCSVASVDIATLYECESLVRDNYFKITELFQGIIEQRKPANHPVENNISPLPTPPRGMAELLGTSLARGLNFSSPTGIDTNNQELHSTLGTQSNNNQRESVNSLGLIKSLSIK